MTEINCMFDGMNNTISQLNAPVSYEFRGDKMAKRKRRTGRPSIYEEMARQNVKKGNIIYSDGVYMELYEKLKRDGKLPKFRAMLTIYSEDNIPLNEVTANFKQMYGKYLTDEWCEQVLRDMIDFYPDLSESWFIGGNMDSNDRVVRRMVKDRADTIATTTSKMKDIEIWENLYGDKKTINGEVDKRTIVNFNLK